MKYIWVIWVIVWLWRCSGSLAAQSIPVMDTSPARMRWYRIDTGHFRILFPRGFERQAQRMANTMEHIRMPASRSMGVTPRKISILLHNEAATSNGFVAEAPWRSEWYATPTQRYDLSGSSDWLAFLAIHEYRHTVQYQRSRKGVGNLVYYLLGELAHTGFAHLVVPQWFWEGDAVATETAFTQSGRGRIPLFNLLMRTNLLEGRVFSYDKQYLRSYKDNIANHYVLGYHMVSFLREKTGDPRIWEKITRRAWKLPMPMLAFSYAIKKETGFYVSELYDEMARSLKEKWTAQQRETSPTAFETITRRTSDVYTDYAYPRPLTDGRVVALKSGIGDISTLVAIDPDGEEQKQFVLGPVNPTGMLSAAHEKVVWNEYRYSPRWAVRSYSVIQGYDLASKEKKTIAKHTRYASAALSPDGKKVATVEHTPDYQSRLVVVDYATGKALDKMELPDHRLISMPRWSDDGRYIVLVALAHHHKSILRYDVETTKIESLLEAGSENVGHPVQHGRYLLYNSPRSGIDNIYAVDIPTRRVFQVTDSRYGSYNPAVSPDGATLYYNEQTGMGLDVVKTPFAPTLWRPVNPSQTRSTGMYGDMLAAQEGRPGLTDSVPSKAYPIRRYRRIAGAINPHTWGAYTNTSFNTLNAGIRSQDVLSTTVIDLGYRYNVNERRGAFYAGLSYQGLYPVFDVDVSYSAREARERYTLNDTLNTVRFNWNETSLEAGVRLPLVATRSKYISGVTIGNAIGVRWINGFRNSKTGNGRFIQTGANRGILFRSYVDDSPLVYNRFSVTARRLLKQSQRDIYSRWGQSLSLNAFFTLPETAYSGSQLSASLIMYFPGLFAHHSLWGYVAYQRSRIEQRTDNYLFAGRVPGPRGQRVSVFENYYTLSANYSLPLLYPDVALGPILNLQRIWATAFIDLALGDSKNFNQTGRYTSIGGELRFDINVARILQKINIGVRYAYGLKGGQSAVEFIVGQIGF